jgi:hypothetical protein
MFKKIALTTLLLGVSYTANAEWVGGIHYHHITDEADGMKVSLSAISGSLGHKIPMQDDRISIIPEIRVGFGIRDDVVSSMGVDVGVEIDGFLGFSLKSQMEVNDNLYVYFAPSYANFNLTATASANSQEVAFTNDSWHFGFGAGLGYHFDQKRSVELAYERFDGVDVLSAGLKFNF